MDDEGDELRVARRAASRESALRALDRLQTRGLQLATVGGNRPAIVARSVPLEMLDGSLVGELRNGDVYLAAVQILKYRELSDGDGAG